MNLASSYVIYKILSFSANYEKILASQTKTPNRAAVSRALRIGFTYEGCIRQHEVFNNSHIDSFQFSIIDKEWPLIKTALEEYLAPENFDPNGLQKRRLVEIRKNLKKTLNGAFLWIESSQFLFDVLFSYHSHCTTFA